MVKEMINKMYFAKRVILVFFIPYVIPIPRESILLEIAKIMQSNNTYKTSVQNVNLSCYVYKVSNDNI